MNKLIELEWAAEAADLTPLLAAYELNIERENMGPNGFVNYYINGTRANLEEFVTEHYDEDGAREYYV